MIARLALVEAKIAFDPIPVDIHRRVAQFEPEYARINPNMTVPSLVLPDRVLSESRDVLAYALPRDDESTKGWLDRHYGFPIEELTFGWLLGWNPLAPRFVERSLAGAETRLRALASEHPDLADRYLRRAEVFAGRRHTFDPSNVKAVYAGRRAEALGFLDALDAELRDRREVLVPPSYGPADVVWTVFLARMRFIRMGAEIQRRPALARYASAMFGRPSFRSADVWARIDPFKLVKQVL
jgi:tetrachloro-p-hydroquinone reductive dehalogenase